MHAVHVEFKLISAYFENLHTFSHKCFFKKIFFEWKIGPKYASKSALQNKNDLLVRKDTFTAEQMIFYCSIKCNIWLTADILLTGATETTDISRRC